LIRSDANAPLGRVRVIARSVEDGQASKSAANEIADRRTHHRASGYGSQSILTLPTRMSPQLAIQDGPEWAGAAFDSGPLFGDRPEQDRPRPRTKTGAVLP
jgi:hypothetical protein